MLDYFVLRLPEEEKANSSNDGHSSTAIVDSGFGHEERKGGVFDGSGGTNHGGRQEEGPPLFLLPPTPPSSSPLSSYISPLAYRSHFRKEAMEYGEEGGAADVEYEVGGTTYLLYFVAFMYNRAVLRWHSLLRLYYATAAFLSECP